MVNNCEFLTYVIKRSFPKKVVIEKVLTKVDEIKFNINNKSYDIWIENHVLIISGVKTNAFHKLDLTNPKSDPIKWLRKAVRRKYD